MTAGPMVLVRQAASRAPQVYSLDPLEPVVTRSGNTRMRRRQPKAWTASWLDEGRVIFGAAAVADSVEDALKLLDSVTPGPA